MKALAFALFLSPVASAQPPHPAAQDLTVRLFDTDRVTSLTVTPLHPGATWKRCPTCARQPIPASLPIQREQLKTTIELTGDLRLDTDTSRRATAAGIWRIDPEPDGLRVRITLPSERYVASVLSGEASPDEPPASLRALAITVRSFALDRAAHNQELCDSTRCQAMRLGSISQAVNEAVLDTAGETLWLDNTRVPAYFTQSSGGTTEDAATVWGGPPKPWLRSHPDPYSDRLPSTWHAELTPDELTQALSAQGFHLHAMPRTLTILRRDSSGRASQLEVQTSANERLTLPAATLRFAINRSLGWGKLRSDLYAVQPGPAGKILFEGRGYGHGVGLSQSGARVMASEGRDDRAILHFYFPGTEVRIDSNDQGWQRHEDPAWTLIAPTLDLSTLQTITAAWTRAQTLFPPPPGHPTPHPALRLFPSTDLYRGVTNEPGWTLGATRGDRIFLQPKSVVARSGNSYTNLLLHELLHVLVEHEATPSTPLWLREGLPEALASPQPHPQSTNARATIEESLRTPANLLEAEKAHKEATALVQHMIHLYGFETVRSWLSRGVPADAARASNSATTASTTSPSATSRR
ncbi:SpoIID/LytB domain-containing protein [Granulicella sibirica]|uniref:Putative sporulation protein SpoIID n=1 Tax=Granulicella sibirica TaxID=2479048 RepID=A0A4Q0T4F3_9BACT|nr:SpoIID/LytB domain-containing protein [Granulicella sibirica]RXH58615.1 putative sporulation protein SpoIID [Granulicella sibirica]